MAKRIYVGVETEVFKTTTCKTDAQLQQFFTIDAGSYTFQSQSNGYWYSNNVDINNTQAFIQLTAKTDIFKVSFSYGVSSEESYDKFMLAINGTSINEISGSKTDNWSGSLAAGETIFFLYTKDSSTKDGTDQAWFYDFQVTSDTESEIKNVAREVKSLYVGVNGVARKIKQGYVGVNGIARSTFPSFVTWRKYDCNVITSSSYYREVEPSSDYGGYYAQDGSQIPAYDDYEFSSEDGYTGVGETTYIMPYALSNIIGHYSVDRTNVRLFDSYIEEGDPDWPLDSPYGYTYYFYMMPVAECERVDGDEDSYEQGDTYYGTIEADEGELPEDGELVDGDVDGFYCVLYFPGDGYYYYERMTT